MRMDAQETIRQIGKMNIFSVSGGRVQMDGDKMILPCGNGYKVEIELMPSDTYTVRRLFARAGKISVKGQAKEVYCDELSEVVYRAGMFRDSWPQGGIN